MSLCVIDASVVIKWLIREDGTPEALALRTKGLVFIAPDLLAPECANILWKHYRRNEISRGQAEATADAIATQSISNLYQHDPTLPRQPESRFL
jgi:predicted nucleic acid-binding protein